jgi:hypothetical protein
MAISFSNLGASTTPDINSSTDAASYASASWAPPASGLIILFVASMQASGALATPTVSGNSLTWTQIATVTCDPSGGVDRKRLTLFGANASGSTTGATTIAFGGTTQIGLRASFSTATGVYLTAGVSAAFVQAKTNFSNSSPTSLSIALSAASHADNRPVSGFLHKINEAATPRSGWTELDDLANSSQDCDLETQYKTTYETTASASWSTTADCCGIAAEIKSDSGGAGTTPSFSTLEYHNGSEWVDITADAITGSLSWDGGIRGSGPTDRVAVPGKMEVELNNAASNSGSKLGYYSPNHANLRAGFTIGKKIRIKLTASGNTRYWLYRIKDIQPTAGRYGERRVTVHAVDYMNEFSKRKVSGLDIQNDQTGEALLATLVATLPFSPTNTSYETGAFVLPYAFHEERDEQTSCLTVVQKIAQSDLSYIYVDGDATDGETLHYESPFTRMVYGSSLGTLSDSMTGLEIEHSAGNIWNKIRGATYPVERDDDVSVLGSIAEEFALEPSETRTIFIPYRDPTSERRISGILSLDPTWGAAPITADTDYKMSSIPADGGNDLNANLTVTAMAGANSILVTLENDAAVKGYVNHLQIRGYAVRSFDRVESVESDSASITAYGEQTLTFNMPYQNNSTLGEAFAAELIRRYKDPGTQVKSVTFIANTSGSLMDYALLRGIGDRLTVSETATGIGADFYIQGYEYELMENNRLRVTWSLEKNYNTTAYWLLGDETYGVLGTSTTLAPL